MSHVRTKPDGVRQLVLTTGRNSLFNFSPEEWEAAKEFFGTNLLLRLNSRVNGTYGTPPMRFEEYEEAAKFAKRWVAEPEVIGEGK
jgi:hypothetical protein